MPRHIKVLFLFTLCFVLFSNVKTQDFHPNQDGYQPQIKAVLDYLNGKPNKVYHYMEGNLVSIQKKPDDISELLVDVNVQCIDIYPGLPCSAQTLVCHGFVRNNVVPGLEPSYQVLSDVICSPKVEISIENEEKEEVKEAVVQNEGAQGGTKNLDLSMEPVSKEQGVDFVAIRRNSVPCLGCPYDLDTDAFGVEELLKTALRHIETEKGQRHTVVNVRRLQQQVVAGVKYVVLMEVGPTTCPKDADVSLPCPLDSSAETALCQVTFIEKPWISKIKHIIKNNCTVSQEYSPPAFDVENDLSPLGGDQEKETKKPEPNYNALAHGNFDDEMDPTRLADLEAQIIADPFIVPHTEEKPRNPTVFIDNLEPITDQQEIVETTQPEDHFQPIETEPIIVDDEAPAVEILLPSPQTEQPEEIKERNAEENAIVKEKESEISVAPELTFIKPNDDLIRVELVAETNFDHLVSTVESQTKSSSESKSTSESGESKEETRVTSSESKEVTDDSRTTASSNSESDEKAHNAKKSKTEIETSKSDSDNDESKSDEKKEEENRARRSLHADSQRSSHNDEDFLLDLEEYARLHGDINSKEENVKRHTEDISDMSEEDDGYEEFRRKRDTESDESHESEESREDNNSEIEIEESHESQGVDSAESHEQNNKKVKRQAPDTNESKSSLESKSVDSADPPKHTKTTITKRDAESSESNESSEEDKDKKSSEKQKKDKKSNESKSSDSDEDKKTENGNDIDMQVLNATDNKTKDIRRRSVGQLEKISAEEKVIVRDLADFAAAYLDKMDDDNDKRVILQILGAKRIKLDGIYYQIILRLGISVCSEHDNNEKCREKLFTNLTKICKVQVHVEDDFSNPKVVKSQCQNIKKDEHDGNRTNYSRYKRQISVGGQVPGGHNTLPVDDPIVKEFVNAVLLHLDAKVAGENKHKAIEVLSATKQVVSGMSYNVKVKLGESICKKSGPQPSDRCQLVEGKEPFVCDINVWDRPWLNKRQFTITCGENKEYTFAAKSTRARRSLLGEKEDSVSVIHPKPQKFVKLGLDYLASKTSYEGRYGLKSIDQVSKQGVSGVFWNIDTTVNICSVFAGEECREDTCRFNVYDQAWLIDGLQINIKCDSDQNVYSFKPGSEVSENGESNVHKHIAKAFNQFVSKHNKVYLNKEEYNYRMKVFRDNLVTISLLNKYEQGTGRYGITKFADMTAKEFSKMHGLRPDLANENEAPFMQAKIPNVTLPTEFDWRTKGAVSEVKDQGSCGSCWAFSVTGNVEGQYAVKHGKLLSLSEQELVDCDKVDEGCNGGLMDNAYRVIEKLGGLEPESAYPYEGEDEKCHFDKSKVAVELSGALNISQNEDDMAKWLVQNGPISIAINANAMQFYMGGVSHPLKFLCSPKSLDHGVLIVGYGVHSYKLFNRTLPFWTIKNSWGTGWGEQGYYRVYRGDGTCGLNQTPSSAIVV